MKFALVTADPAHLVKFKIDGNSGDATSFMNWIDVWNGVHLSFEKLGRKEDVDFLKTFDVVMFSGHLNHIQKIIDLGKLLKDSETITIYYPEGSTQLYDNSINGFHPEYYEAWNACDIVSPAEEDKISYYESFISSGTTIVRFIHVPLREEMETGDFFVPRNLKINDLTLVYGDNNPNHPMIALACANKMGYYVTGVEMRNNLLRVQKVFPKIKMSDYSKQGQYRFLQLLGKTMVHFYPTEWIGTARQQISCACVGTPCIGNKDSHTQQRLFPKLGVDIYDVDRMVELAKILTSDHDFYESVVKYAYENMNFYSLRDTKYRFVSAVSDAKCLKRLANSKKEMAAK